MSKRTLSRRDFLRMTALISTGAVVAACQPQAAKVTTEIKETPEVETKITEPPKAEEVTISFMGWGGPEESQAVLDVIARFESKNPSIKVTWLHTPQDYMTKLFAMIASGTQPDTLFTPQDYYKTFCKQGLMLDIQDYLDVDTEMNPKTYFLQPQEDGRSAYKGRWHGIGVCWVGMNIFYNADMFQEAGIEPPSNDPEKAWSWDHFVEVARQFTKDSKGRHPKDSGFDKNDIVQWGIDYNHAGWANDALVLLNGVEMVDTATNKFKIDDPAAIEAMQNVADLMFKHWVAPLASNFKDLGMSSAQMLENRKLPMFIDYSPNLSWIHKLNCNLGTACPPKMKQTASVIVADVRGAMKATKHPDAAYKFVRMTADPVYQSTFLKIGLWWPNQTSLLTPEGLKSWISERKSPTEGIHPAGYIDLITKFLPNYTKTWLCPPGFGEAELLINSSLESLWNGTATAQQAVESCISKANAILQKESD